MSFSWICYGVCFALTVAGSVGLTNPSEEELKAMKEKWDECCKTNVCIQNSCYTTEWGASGWAAVRQRCQGKYPDWPYAVDIFRIQNQKDIETLSKMLQNGPGYSGGSPTFPRTVWTSGTRCPKTGSEGPVLVTRWTSTNSPFPDWLDSKISSSSTDIPDKNEGCKFLVIYPKSNDTDIKYDFQDQTARHAAICEFLFPGEVEYSTNSDVWNVTEETTHSYTVTLNPKTVTSDYRKTTFITRATTRPANELNGSSEEARKTTHPTIELTTDSFVTKTSPDKDENEFPSTANIDRFCSETTAAGIDWPEAKAGATITKECPKGMTGYAQWKCDELTLQYTPAMPHIQDCKHVWIRNLEKDVDSGTNAVSISHKLADETGKQKLSHGDITALVDLSIKLLGLYIKQASEQPEHLEQPLSFNFTGHMVSSMSNILRAEIKTAWEILPEIHQTREASKILKLVTDMGSRLSCIKKSTSKLQFTVAAENIGLQTFIMNNTSTSQNDVIVFPQRVPGVEANSSLQLPADLQLDNWYSPCSHFKTAVGVIYNHVGDFLKNENQTGSSTHVATKVISFSLSNNTESVPLPKGKNVTVILEHTLIHNIQKGRLRNPRCMFWNFSKQTYGQWDSSGCQRLYTNQTHTVCTCNHLTNFAVLMDVNNNTKEDKILSLMTYICCGASSLALIITLICFIAIKSLHGRRSIITGNLCFSLLVTNLLVIFGLDKTQNKIVCSTIAILLHFWILSSFFWMLVEGYHLYKMVILVFQRGSNWSVKFYYLFAYGAPIVIVGVSAAIRIDGYGGNDYCWLSQGLMWSFIGPACAIILVNSVVFFLTLRSASNVRIKREQTTIKKIKSWARGSMSVMCLLGLTWCLGLLYIDVKFRVVSYIFTFINGLQGVFIFIFHILFNDKVNVICFKKWNGKKHERWKKFPTQTSSNHLHSKTSTRNSVHSNGCAAHNASEFNSRTVSTGITSISNSNLSRENRSSYSNEARTVNSGMNSRKIKAMHTMSESRQFPLPEQCEIRSRSFSDEPKYKFQRNGAHTNLGKSFHKPCERFSTSRPTFS